MTMSLGNVSFTSALLTLGFIFVMSKVARFGIREKNLPPGPPTYPIIGNAHLVVDKELYKRLVRSSSVP